MAEVQKLVVDHRLAWNCGRRMCRADPYGSIRMVF
jgi:hypothetical protein